MTSFVSGDFQLDYVHGYNLVVLLNPAKPAPKSQLIQVGDTQVYCMCTYKIVPFFHTTRTYFVLSHALLEKHVSSRGLALVAEPATMAASSVSSRRMCCTSPPNLTVDPHSEAGRLARRP